MHKLLVVDDEEDMLYVSASYMKEKGYNVYALANAGETLEVLKLFKPHLVVLDIKAGDYDGRMICQQIKSNAESQSIKIILSSAFADLQRGFKSYGADDFIQKPFNLEEFHNRIKEHLEVKK